MLLNFESITQKFSGSGKAIKEASPVLVLSAIFLLLFFRNIRLFVCPVPWGEDFAIFISQEYSTGFPRTAFNLYAGYIHLLPRIIAWLSVNLGMYWAMFAINWSVLLIKVWIFYLIYKSDEIRSGIVKFSLLGYLILLPFCDEIYNNVTNLQWWLIPLMALIILRRCAGIAELAADVLVLALAGLTGVNSVMFALPCVFLLFRIRTTGCLVKCLAVIICACVQLWCLWTSGRSGNGTLMYQGGIFGIVSLFVNRVIFTTLFQFHSESPAIILVFIIYAAVLAFNLWIFRKNSAVHFIFIFAAVYSAVIFYNFMKTMPDFHELMSGWAGERYFVFLRICTFVMLVSSLGFLFRRLSDRRNCRRLMLCLLLALCVVVARHCHYHVRFPFDYPYYSDLERFESAGPGESVTFHYAPGWSTVLTRK